jgi:Tfp pilus assembly protein PilN
MRAVNLLPTEQRRSRTSGVGLGSYIVIGVLTVAVGLSAAYALANRTISHRRHELADVQAQAKASANEASALQAYTAFNSLREKRHETVRSLAASRFDWSRALHELARTMPSDAWLTGLRGTVTPSAQVDGGVTDPLRASIDAPAIEIVGCTTSQEKVAAVVASLRRISGIQRVSLSSSERLAPTADAGAGAGDSATKGGGTDCRNGNTQFPQFSMTLFFKTPTGLSAAAKGTTP